MKEINKTQSNPKKEESNKIIRSKSNQTPKEQSHIDTTAEIGTTVSTLIFIQNNPEIGEIQISQNPNLNLERTIPKDTISTSTGTKSNTSQQDSMSDNSNKSENTKISFARKTKQWAGNAWNSIKKINIKNMFPKTEYQEFRNVNGDIVKIPKKKIPLKKKKLINENVSKRISMEQNKVISTYHGVATGLYTIS